MDHNPKKDHNPKMDHNPRKDHNPKMDQNPKNGLKPKTYTPSIPSIPQHIQKKISFIGPSGLSHSS